MIKLYILVVLITVVRVATFYVANPGAPDKNWGGRGIEDVRQRIERVYFNGLSGRQAQLVSGIVLGGAELSPEFKDKLSLVGLSHVVSASGMNVTLVAGFIGWFLTKLKLSPGGKIIFSLAVIWFYSGITGFDPPIVRAAIMASVALGAISLGRGAGSWISLLMTGCLMLWASPRLLVDYGFLLSFSSMIGQLSLSALRLRLPFLLEIVAQSFLQSVAASLTTLPLLLLLFHKFSLTVFISNTLVLWTVEPIMMIGGLAAIVSVGSSELASIIVATAEPLAKYFLRIVDQFSGPEFSSWQLNWEVNFFFVGGYYALVGILIYLLERRARSLQVSRILTDPIKESRIKLQVNLAMKDSRS